MGGWTRRVISAEGRCSDMGQEGRGDHRVRSEAIDRRRRRMETGGAFGASPDGRHHHPETANAVSAGAWLMAAL